MTIKQAPHEKMTNFNYRFQRTWSRIPVQVTPSKGHAFLYYLRSLNSDIFIMIQSMRGYSLLKGFDIPIRDENSLFQVGKISLGLKCLYIQISKPIHPSCTNSKFNTSYSKKRSSNYRSFIRTKRAKRYLETNGKSHAKP